MSIESALLFALCAALLGAILAGVPVAFALLGVPFAIALVGAALGAFDFAFIAAFTSRVFGLLTNPVLVSVPLFVLMGALLERADIARRMTLTAAALFGDLRGGLACAVILVGALLAASTGVIAATIFMLGMIALPAMLRANYSKRLSAGVICAAGSLGQIIPPSILLILLADQISAAYQSGRRAAGEWAAEPVSTGDIFAGALLPGLLLVGLYLVYVAGVAALKPASCPPVRASQIDGGGDSDGDVAGDGEGDGGLSRHPRSHPPRHPRSLLSGGGGDGDGDGGIDGDGVGIGDGDGHSDSGDGVTRLTVAAVLRALVVPLLLIALVLGSILGGVATPTESAALGAVGALLLVAANRDNPRAVRWLYLATALAAVLLLALRARGHLPPGAVDGGVGPAAMLAGGAAAVLFTGVLTAAWREARHGELFAAAKSTAVMVAAILLIVIGAFMLALVFRGLGGEEAVAALLAGVPGGAAGALVAVMAVVFVLGFILEYVEIIFIVVPIACPPLFMAGVDPVWLAVLISLNLQMSFLTPPFGYALFYLRSVADRRLATRDIYRAVIPFIVIQLIALMLVAMFPAIATWLPAALYR